VPLTHLSSPDHVAIAWRIDASVDRVWACLTQGEFLGQWLGRTTHGSVAADTEFVVDHGESYLCRSTVTRYDEPTRLAFTWLFPHEPESAVSITLESASDGVDLYLQHEALGALAVSYRDGWCVHLSYLEAAALGDPLPISMFWRLHGTIARLNAPVRAEQR